MPRQTQAESARRAGRRLAPQTAWGLCFAALQAWCNLALRIRVFPEVSLPVLSVPRNDEAYLAHVLAVALCSACLLLLRRRSARESSRHGEARCLCVGGVAMAALTVALLFAPIGAAGAAALGAACGVAFTLVAVCSLRLLSSRPFADVVWLACVGLVGTLPLEGLVAVLPEQAAYALTALLPLAPAAAGLACLRAGERPRQQEDGLACGMPGGLRHAAQQMEGQARTMPALSTVFLVTFAFAVAIGGVWFKFSGLSNAELLANQALQSLVATCIACATLGVCLRLGNLTALVPATPFLSGTAFLILSMIDNPVSELCAYSLLQASVICTFLIIILVGTAPGKGARAAMPERILLVGALAQVAGVPLGWALRSLLGYSGAVTSAASLVTIYVVMIYLMVLMRRQGRTQHVVQGTVATEEEIAHIRACALQQRHPDVTDREAQTLELVLLGLTNARIAERLGISENTVKTHVKHLFEKLAVAGRQELQDLARTIEIRQA